MKKIFIGVVLMLTAFCGFAGIISVDSAGRFAQKFIGASEVHLYDSTSEVVIFNTRPKGFVVVSRETNSHAIIGFSNESYFQYNSNNYWFVKDRANQIDSIRLYCLEATPSIKAEWEGKSTVSYSRSLSAVSPLITTSWNQSPLYNDSCPLYGASRSVIGCVATTNSQIMRYWKYPIKGTGSYSYADSISKGFANNIGNVSANFGNTVYNWANMPNAITSHNNDVSEICFHAGASVGMDYGASSGAWVIKADKPNGPSSEVALVKYFGYNPYTIRGIRQSAYDSATWTAIIKAELDSGRPVSYAGWDLLFGGHNWVCDGYQVMTDGSILFHMNWGWGGQANGYYAINSLHPSGTFYLFGQNDEALIGIQPGSVSPCSDVSNVAVSNSNAALNVTWNSAPGTVYYTVYWQDTITKVISFANTTSTSYTIPNILGGKTYLVQVQTNCTGGIGHTLSAPLITTPICTTSVGWIKASADTSSITETWKPATGAVGYNLQIININTNIPVGTYTTSNTSYKFTGLKKIQYYSIYCSSVCTNSLSSTKLVDLKATTATDTVTTVIPPIPPTPPTPIDTYCVSKGASQTFEYLKSVAFDSTNLQVGKVVTMVLTPGYKAGVWPENWYIYVDYNQNALFTDGGELVLTTKATNATTVTFTVPATAKTGVTKLRAIMSYSTTSLPCGSYSYGQTEDFNVNIVAKAASDLDELDELSIYPNPTRDYIVIEYPKPAIIEIYTITGQHLLTTPIDNSKTTLHLDFPSGTYIVRVVSGTSYKSKLFIIQK